MVKLLVESPGDLQTLGARAEYEQLAARLYEETPTERRAHLASYFHALGREFEKLYHEKVLEPDFQRRLGGTPARVLSREDITKLF